MFRLLVAAAIVAGSFPLAPPVAGQATETAPAIVTGVTVLVDGKPAPAAFRDLISIKPGDPYSRAAIDRVVKQVYRTGLFADVQVVRSGEPNAAVAYLKMSSRRPRRLGMLFRNQMCATGTASSMCPMRSRRTRAIVTSTPQRSQMTSLYLIRLYFPQAHS